MKLNRNLLTKAEEIRSLCDQLNQSSMVAFDTEFIRETTFFPKLEILQVATGEESWLIDARAFIREDRVDELQPLFDVFQNPKILKVLHAAQADQECLYTSFGLTASPSIDTAVAASLCGYGDGIGLGNLVNSVLDIKLKKGHARTNWSARPLPKQQADYALSDVEYLVEVIEVLLKRLDKRKRREWALELSAKYEDESLYSENPGAIAERLSQNGRINEESYPILIELVTWRERRVREMNVPRRWLADDGTLIDLARVRPKDAEHLRSFRGVNKGELKNNPDPILDAIKRGLEKGPTDLPKTKGKRTSAPSQEESQAIEILRCYMGLLANEHQVALRHLVDSKKLLHLLRSKVKSVEDLAEKGFLSPRAAELVGQDLLHFIHGQRALSLNEKKVRVIDV